MKFDTTVTISVLLALSAILANVITTILNNRHQSKLKKLEMYELQKREVLQNFINVTIDCFGNYDNYYINKDFTKAIYTLQLYFKSANITFIEMMNELMKDSSGKNRTEFNTSFAKIINKLSEEIQKH